jgi:hypothetical protein
MTRYIQKMYYKTSVIVQDTHLTFRKSFVFTASPDPYKPDDSIQMEKSFSFCNLLAKIYLRLQKIYNSLAAKRKTCKFRSGISFIVCGRWTVSGISVALSFPGASWDACVFVCLYMCVSVCLSLLIPKFGG